MKRYLPLFLIVILSACSTSPLDMSEEEIDAYVEERIQPTEVYDIIDGLRYSKDDLAYQVTEYSQNDSIILHNSEETTQFSAHDMNIFYKDGWPVYIEEYIWDFPEDAYKVTERKVYLTGDDVLAAYERTSDSDESIETAEFEEVDVVFSDYDLQRPADAIQQAGQFEMKFGEFLIINPDSYLILDNDESGYGIALYILEGDMLLDELYQNPDSYQGKTIFAQHEFMSMNGIERMIYRGGIVKD